MDQKVLKLLLEEIREVKKAMVTKHDLEKSLIALKKDLIEEIKESEGFIVASVDRNKADKSVVDALDARVTKLEHKISI